MPLNQAGTLKITHPGSIAQTLAMLTQSGVLADFGGISGTINQRLPALSQRGALSKGPSTSISQTLAKLSQRGNFTDTPTTGRCLMGSAYPDGCPGAPTGTPSTAPGAGQGLYQNPAFFTYARQSSQAPYVKRPAWNVAGVEYAVGIPSSVTLLDPTVSVPPGCTLSAHGSVLGGPIITCGSFAHPAVNPTIRDYDFSLYGGIPLLIDNHTTGTITISNCKFVTGSNICAVQGTITATFSTVSGVTTMTMTGLVSGSAPVLGQVVQLDEIVELPVSAQVTTITAVISAWNGSSGTYTISAPMPAAFNAGATCFVGKTQTYNVEVQSGANANVVISNCFVDGNAVNSPIYTTANLILAHTGTTTISYCAFLRCNCRPANVTSPGALLVQFNYVEDFDRAPVGLHGEVIGNFFTGGPQTSAIYSFNTCLQGSTIPPYATTMFFLASGVTRQTIALGQVDHNTCVTNVNPSLTMFGGITTSQACCEYSDDTFTNAVITDNYVDHTGSFHSFAATTAAIFTNPPVFSGNINMVDGSAITGFGAN